MYNCSSKFVPEIHFAYFLDVKRTGKQTNERTNEQRNKTKQNNNSNCSNNDSSQTVHESSFVPIGITVKPLSLFALNESCYVRNISSSLYFTSVPRLEVTVPAGWA